jgi:hypothetical protein
MSSVEPLCSVRYANEMRLMGSWQKRRSACKSLNFRYEIRRSELPVGTFETVPTKLKEVYMTSAVLAFRMSAMGRYVKLHIATPM